MYAGMSTRIASSLMLHSPTRTEPPAVAEHRKRVWWTTFLMDAMVSSEMGLRATFGFEHTEHSLPSDAQLPAADRDDFWDSQIMTAHLKLCNIKSLILDTIGRLQQTDFASYEKLIEVPLCGLESWKRELSPVISFEFSNGVPQAMLDRPSMRSLASCYLRYHQVR
jgi:proline utilization trans-activator